jgi:hypothetical protein
MDLDGRAFKRVGNALVPVDFAADELVASLPEGKEVLVVVRRARSVAHHRWFFALLRVVVDNTEARWLDEEQLLNDLKLSVGHFSTSINLMTGEEHLVPRSISFASMEQGAFWRFTNRCLWVLGTKVLHIDPAVLMAEVSSKQPPINVPKFIRSITSKIANSNRVRSSTGSEQGTSISKAAGSSPAGRTNTPQEAA